MRLQVNCTSCYTYCFEQVGVVSFSSDAESPPGTVQTSGCYSTMLAKATPLNKAYLETYVQDLTAEGGTVYGKAFQKAFKLIANAGDDQFDDRPRGEALATLYRPN